MKTPEILNSKSLKGFIKGSLALIGLYVVLSFGVSAFIIYSDKYYEINKNINNNKNYEGEKNILISKIIDCKSFLLILILTIPPLIIFVIIFFKFSRFMESYCKSPCNNYEEIISQIKENRNVLTDIKRIEDDILEKKKEEKTNYENYRCKKEEIIKMCKLSLETINLFSEKDEEKIKKILENLIKILSE